MWEGGLCGECDTPLYPKRKTYSMHINHSVSVGETQSSYKQHTKQTNKQRWFTLITIWSYSLVRRYMLVDGDMCYLILINNNNKQQQILIKHLSFENKCFSLYLWRSIFGELNTKPLSRIGEGSPLLPPVLHRHGVREAGASAPQQQVKSGRGHHNPPHPRDIWGDSLNLPLSRPRF